MRSFLGLFFLIDFRGFFHFGKAGAKNTGDVHPFEPLFVYVSRRFLAMKNSGRFHACFSLLFLFKPCGNRPCGLSILKKATLLMFRDMFCRVLRRWSFWLRFEP